ncbi:M23 family metallopeptidase [Gorillibacterium massiliense]|uniref:M23 family metallopeptidase n=1 Tax=Gorillibacterium massiliense TaxID=1280390 RepID=UPI00059526A8|nr:M23 family metallopeptidase [Gorillibacterium massiliense]
MSIHKRRTRLILAIVAALLVSMAGKLPGIPGILGEVKAEPAKTEPVEDIYKNRMELLQRISQLTAIPWYELAAVDQYDRTLRKKSDTPAPAPLVGLRYTDPEWAGLVNPDAGDTNPLSILVFDGKGRDGNGNGTANRSEDEDLLRTFMEETLKHGEGIEGWHKELAKRYENPRALERIAQFSAIYLKFGRLDLNRYAFPLPISSSYSYRSTWGDRRGWGGRRIHEGTDLFAGYGVPVRSTCYGIIEQKGWNPFGGWRIGIRDLNNRYHYYAHLSGYAKGLQQGDIVEPGQTLGWVGSSGYGKPGTSGKFPPHLHFGLYKDNGHKDWAYDPYPSLKRWEREDRKRLNHKD